MSYYANTTSYYTTEVYKTKLTPLFYTFTPVFIVVGVVGNLLVLLVMPRSIVKTSATSRVYYCWIAFFDMLTILSKDVFFSFLLMGMSSAFNDIPPYFSNVLLSSNVCCKILAYVYNFAELTVNNTVVALAVERIIVMYFPFRAKQLTGKRKANGGLGFLLIIAVSFSVGFLFSGRVIPLPGFTRVTLCVSGNPDYPIASEIVVAVYMLIYVIPTFFGALMVAAVVIKMKSILSKSRQLTRKNDDDFGSKELKSTIVMIATVVMNIVIFMPIGLCFCVLTAAQLMDPTNGQLQLLMTIIWLQIYPFAIIPHSCQIFIYCSQVQGFTQGIASLFKGSRN